MGRVRNGGKGHRSGPLKQTNKKHKTGQHRSKGMLDKETKGRVGPSGGISKKTKKLAKRNERKKQAAVERMKKMSSISEKKRNTGGGRGAPISVALIPLSPTTNVDFTLKFIMANVKEVGTPVGQSDNGNVTYFKLSNGKNITIIKPPSNDLWAIMDTLKQSDISLFVMPIMEDLTPEALTLLRTSKEQGLCTPFVGVTSTFTKQEEKSFLKSVKRYLTADRLFPMTNATQMTNLLRMISVTKITVPRQWELRSSMFIENCRHHLSVEANTLHANYTAATPGANTNLLEVTGVVRRKNLNPHRPIFIAGLGSFKIVRADVTPMQVPIELLSESQKQSQAQLQSSEVSLPPRFLFDPLAVPQDVMPTSTTEEDDTMDSDDDISEGDYGSDGDDNSSQMSVDGGSRKNDAQKKLPKGTSEYQAEWLLNSDGEANDDIIGSDEDVGSDSEEDEGSEEEIEDEEMDWEEEKKQLQISKDAKVEAEFPDWIDTPMEIPAKTRFQKYRGLQSFKTSKWDINENLPKEYKNIFQFHNFKHIYKMVVKETEEEEGSGFIPIGQRIRLLLKPDEQVLSLESISSVGSSKPLSLVSLLQHEGQMSVLNFQLSLTEIVKNKEELIFQIGHLRFKAKPILSEVSPGDKHRMLRFGQANSTCMATVFGPIIYPPASVVAFKASKNELVPVGSGTLFSIDPARLVIKRILLSGHPFKAMNKNAVIRFMFFNREDIEWFKPIELRTRYGRRGHIKEPLGTHGHMKCTFDGTMKSQDTVLMPLYKRVFPKFSYDSFVPSFVVYDSYQK